jgi:deoxyribonuclease V
MTRWPATIAEAKLIQETLARRVKLVPLKGKPFTVVGVDAAFTGTMTIAAAVLFDLATMTCLAEAHHVATTTFPYVPGYLSFREGPAILAALDALPATPDVILCDGQGIAHPRKIGIASHLGVLAGIPTVGCAKSRLVGEFDEPPPERGTWSDLLLAGETVGAVLRTRDRVRPLFVSPGHLITLDEARDLVLRCCVRYRLPEPIRHADALVKRLKNTIAPG